MPPLPTFTPEPFSTLVGPVVVPIGETVIANASPETTIQYAFEGSRGQIVDIRVRFTATDRRLGYIITTPTGYHLRPGLGQLGDGSSAFRLPDDGEYLIQLISDHNIGEYSLTIAEPDGQPIDGEMQITGTLSERRDVVYYTFEAEAGDLIFASAEAPSFRPIIDIAGMTNYRDMGNLVVPTPNRIGESQTRPIIIPETGTYYLLLHGNIMPTVTNPLYDFTLNFFHNPDMQTLAYGDEIEGTLAADERMQFYRFEAGFGEIIDINAYTDGDVDTFLSLYTPTGSSVNDDDSGPGVDPEISRYLLFGGEHIIGVGAFHAGEVGDYTLSLQRSTGVSLNEEPRIARFDKSNVATFNFMAEAGSQVTLLLERLEGDHIPLMQVSYEINGRLLELAASDIRRLSLDLEIPVTGTYTVGLERRYPYNEGTGPVIRITLED